MANASADRIRRLVDDLLGSPVVVWFAVALGIVLCLPSLGEGLCLDDHGIALLARKGGPWWDLFSLTRHAPLSTLRDQGVVGWWAADDLNIRFLRPLASLTHYADFRLWPQHVWLMHLWSVLCYGAVILLAGRLYQSWCSTSRAAGVAVLLFAVDHLHAITVGWIAGRNTLLATLAGLATVWAHDRWRRGGRVAGLAAPLLLCVALLCGEYGVTCIGYLLAYAVFLEQGRWWRRALTALPYVALAAVWRVAYIALGYGATGSGLYADPQSSPLSLPTAIGRTVCVSAATQLANPASMLLVAPPGGWIAGAAICAVVVWLLWPVLARDRSARFLFAGMLLSAVPLGATTPQDRLQIVLGLGGAGLIAQVLAASGSRATALAHATGRVLWVLKGPVAVLLFVPMLLAPGWMDRVVRRGADAYPPTETVVILNAPNELVALYPRPMRELDGRRHPERACALHAGTDPVTVERVGQRAVRLRAPRGRLAKPMDRIVRSLDRPFRVGDLAALTAFTARVQSVSPDGRPLEVVFEFREDLDKLGWVAWDGSAPRPWHPPAIGETQRLQAALLP